MPPIRLSARHKISAWGLVLLAGSLIPRIGAASDPVTEPLPPPAGHVVLLIDGAIQHTNTDKGAHLDFALLQQLPVHRLRTSTSVTDGIHEFQGVLMRNLLDWVGAQGSTVEARALNHYNVTIPLQDFYDYDVLLATHMDGTPLKPADKGPLWIVYPRDDWRKLQDIRYDYRWVWQLHRLTVK